MENILSLSKTIGETEKDKFIDKKPWKKVRNKKMRAIVCEAIEKTVLHLNLILLKNKEEKVVPIR